MVPIALRQMNMDFWRLVIEIFSIKTNRMIAEPMHLGN